MSFEISPIGYVRSTIRNRTGAPRQASEGAPAAWIEIEPGLLDALDGLNQGQEIWILTWLHETDRSVLKVRPRGEAANPSKGVFATRSPDRPNPIGLHRATIVSTNSGGRIQVDALEVIDGTPVLDIKPVLECRPGR
ncbi:MAG TPA: tRNA (N6-threonylcarbamoyladenosine(37)-N6)-methyltransferase TrmO [Bryobacteraceae bacterium]|nr:tRNA (N6-threonylcarbamoyladenosine(37)-N6)-methyltransferase TrmO [Bryobacteraceae bacterium]